MTNAQAATFDDSALIKRVLEGQTEYFAALMDRHLMAVRKRIIFMVRSATDVEDLLQDVALKVWRHLSTFRSESSFRTWITSVAINEVLQLNRRERSRLFCWALDDLDFLCAGTESPHQSFAQAEMRQTIRHALKALPEKYRVVLVLRDLEELTGQETAQRLRLTIPAVKTRLFRARLMLLEELQRPDVEQRASAPVSRRTRLRQGDSRG